MTVGVLWLFLSVPLVGLQGVIARFFLVIRIYYFLTDWFEFNIGLQMSNRYDLMSTSLHTQFKRSFMGFKEWFSLRARDTKPRGYKILSMLNSPEQEIYPAHKC